MCTLLECGFAHNDYSCLPNGIIANAALLSAEQIIQLNSTFNIAHGGRFYGQIKGRGLRTRFIHTSDWQLGVTRQFLGAGLQAFWAESCFDEIRNMGRITEEGCKFIVVAGDRLESNRGLLTFLKACEAKVRYLGSHLPPSSEPRSSGCLQSVPQQALERSQTSSCACSGHYLGIPWKSIGIYDLP